jgi:hypothetical protein
MQEPYVLPRCADYVFGDIVVTICRSRLYRVIWKGSLTTLVIWAGWRCARPITRYSFAILQAIQELEKLVCGPVAPLPAAGRRCLRKSFLLHCECRFDIDLRGFHRFMSEPQRNH